MTRIDWLGMLRHLLQVIAFSLAIAAVLIGFEPDKSYGPAAVHSVLIGGITWAVIDFGRHAFPSDTGWPRGPTGVLLVVAGIVAGYTIGMPAGHRISQWYGWRVSLEATDWRTSALVTVLAGIVGSLWFYTRGKSSYLERRMGEVQRHADEARLKLLEAQLEPHMLFNTLANLRALIALDPQRAQQMLDHIIAYLRATLDASRATTHGLQHEFDRLRDYLELMSIRMGPRLAYTLDLPPELAAQPVPTLLLQPLVENSIQHGLEPKLEGGRIAISARREGEQLVLEIVDTGVGASAPSVSAPGFGLAQIRDRLATLHGHAAGLEVQPVAGQGMRAVVRLPVQA